MKKVAAIIVTYNGEEFIWKCINSVVQDSEIDYVIVVDNNSSDHTLEVVSSNFKEVHIIKLDDNVGFGQANNIGLEYALDKGCNYFFLLNQDAYCEAKCVTGLIEIHKKNINYGILAPVQLDGSGNEIDFKFYDYLFIQNRRIASDIFTSKSKEIYEVDFVNAAAWLISKECLQKVGGFDPIFFHTGEDDDYVQRAKQWGFKIGIAPHVLVKHDRPQVSWEKQIHTLGRQRTLDILSIKDLRSPLKSNFKRYLKKMLYYIAYDLGKGRAKSAKIKIDSLFSVCKILSEIERSRNESLKEFAYLKR